MTTTTRDDGTGSRVTFDRGIAPLLGFGVFFAVLAVLAVLIEDAFAGVSYPTWVAPVAGVGKFALLAGVTLVVLRIEGVRPTELGLSPRLLKPAVLTVAGVWMVLNALAAGLAVATGNEWGLDVLLDVPVRWDGAPAAVSLLYEVLVVALVEEFVFRGYLQSKVIAILGDSSRYRIGLGVLTAALVFGAMHAPGAIVAGAGPSGVLFTVLFLSLSGIAFGVLYELTRNVYLTALLHALGNTWILVADIWTWSGTAFTVALVGVLVVYAGATVAYWFWTRPSDRQRGNEVNHGLSDGRSSQLKR